MTEPRHSVGKGSFHEGDYDSFFDRWKKTDLHTFILDCSRSYAQFIFAFIASSGLISTFVYFWFYRLNAHDIINLTDVLYNSAINAFIITPAAIALTLVLAFFHAIWLRIVKVADRSQSLAKAARSLSEFWVYAFRIYSYAATFLAVVWLLIVAFVYLLKPQSAELGASEAYSFLNGLLHGSLFHWHWPSTLNFPVLCWGLITAGFLGFSIFIYPRLTRDFIPAGLWTAVCLFVGLNATLGWAAYYMRTLGHPVTIARFFSEDLAVAPDKISDKCPGAKSMIWSGDRAIVVLCQADQKKYVYYKIYDTVVEKP